MAVVSHDNFHGGNDLFALGATGKPVSQRHGGLFGMIYGLEMGPNAGYGSIEFTLAVGFLGVAHGNEQLIQMRVFQGGQMSVSIHGQNEEIEQGILLGGGKIGQNKDHSVKKIRKLK